MSTRTHFCGILVTWILLAMFHFQVDIQGMVLTQSRTTEEAPPLEDLEATAAAVGLTAALVGLEGSPHQGNLMAGVGKARELQSSFQEKTTFTFLNTVLLDVKCVYCQDIH